MKDRFITTGSDMCKQFRSAFIGMPGVTIYADEIISEGDFLARYASMVCTSLRYADSSVRSALNYAMWIFRSEIIGYVSLPSIRA